MMSVLAGGKIIWTKKQQENWYFKLRCWLAFQYWWKILLIPYHIVAGYYYGYSTKEIYYFCKRIIMGG